MQDNNFSSGSGTDNNNDEYRYPTVNDGNADSSGTDYQSTNNSSGGYVSTGAGNTYDGGTYNHANYNTSSYNAANYSNVTDSATKSKGKGKTLFDMTFGQLVPRVVALALVFGLITGAVTYSMGIGIFHVAGKTIIPAVNTLDSANTSIPVASGASQSLLTGVSDVVDNVLPSIVAITNTMTVTSPDFFGRTKSRDVPAAGSGIIVGQTDSELYIVTNNHVVAGSTSLSVTFADDQTVEAQIKGTDSSDDLAVVSVPIASISADTLSKIKVAALGNSENLKVGEAAIAIGNALGYGQSVTTGVVSALNREVTVQDSNGNDITNTLIQTSAAINPGNSGGALLNAKGEVIGINSVKYADTGVEGMGYAIPISAAQPIINDLITRTVVDDAQKGVLGITGISVTSDVSTTYNMPKGVYITQVAPASGAEGAGLKQGDIITALDGKSIDGMEALQAGLQYCSAGSEVNLTVMRSQDGSYKEQSVKVTLGKKS
ncbi:hypothetical protein FACS1894111_06330 [Clostridia bacterium]|nr:hypothetical protein FACS1894111_06330 [Clostridia bacterium]